MTDHRKKALEIISKHGTHDGKRHIQQLQCFAGTHKAKGEYWDLVYKSFISIVKIDA